MQNYKMFNILKDIIGIAYPEAEYPDNKFKKIYIELIPKEMKTIHGRYFPQLKKIQVFNLSRPTGHIVATTIHEVSHHIDHCLRDDSDHSKAFYEIMHKMLLTAMSMGVITKDDVITANDNKDKDRLIKYFGEIETWNIGSIDYHQNIAVIKVTSCFLIKDKLKARGYSYSRMEQTWEKEVDEGCLDAEKEFLSGLIVMDNVKIINGNEIDIEAVYYVCVLNSYAHKDYLKANGYFWNGYNKIKKNSWTKKILAKDKDEELEKVINLEGVKVQLVSRK